MNTIRILVGDALERLKSLPDESIHCCVTSPPYYQLRDYEVDGQIGQESTPEDYVESLCAVFDEVRRVLRRDGTFWLNIGDTYSKGGNGTKAGDLTGVPWLLAFALRKRGWYLRSEIVWGKNNAVPESVHSRPTTAHEKVFLLSRSVDCYYDWWGMREGSGFYPTRQMRDLWMLNSEPNPEAHFAVFPPELPKRAILASTSPRCCASCGAPQIRQFDIGRRPGRSKRLNPYLKQGVTMRDVERRAVGWEPGCKCGAETKAPVVLDPFFGAGTTGLVAGILHRDCIGIELNPKYAEMAARRINKRGGFFFRAVVELAEANTRPSIGAVGLSPAIVQKNGMIRTSVVTTVREQNK